MDVNNKWQRRSQWYWGTDQEKQVEARNRKREWMTIVQSMKQVPQNPVCAEIGVWEGEHAWIMLHVLNPSKLVLIDPFRNMNTFVGVDTADDEDAIGWVKDIFNPFPQVEVIRETSMGAVSVFPDKYFDYVYIDGAHDYDHAKEDIIAWWPKISDMGCLCGHDAGHDGVIRALKEFNNPSIIVSPNGTEWVIPKNV